MLDRLLSDANPWWRDPRWTERDVQLLRAARAPFSYTPDVLAGLTAGGLYLLRGPRRVGKSTEIKRAIAALMNRGAAPRRVVYLSVEGWRSHDLEQMIMHTANVLDGSPGTCFWFLDEVTAIDGPWPAVVKRMRDSNLHFAEDTVVLSGSSAAQLDDATKALAGRRGRAVKTDRLLLQMPFVEFAHALGRDLPNRPPVAAGDLSSVDMTELTHTLRPWVTDMVDLWDIYLRVGGYPQAVADYVNSGSVDASFTDTLFEIVHGDALAKAELSPTQTVAMLRTLSRSLSSLLEVASVATDTDIPYHAAKARLEDLRRSFLAYPVYREQGLAPKPRSQAKWYFTDPLLAALAAARGGGSAPDATKLSEQQLALALLRSLESTSSTAALRHDQLLYYRSATRAEIDFVSAGFNGVCFESKFVDRGWGRAFQTIESSPYERGFVATRSALKSHNTGWAMPAGLLALVLGS